MSEVLNGDVLAFNFGLRGEKVFERLHVLDISVDGKSLLTLALWWFFTISFIQAPFQTHFTICFQNKS